MFLKSEDLDLVNSYNNLKSITGQWQDQEAARPDLKSSSTAYFIAVMLDKAAKFYSITCLISFNFPIHKKGIIITIDLCAVLMINMQIKRFYNP